MAHQGNLRVVDADLSALAQDYHNQEFVWEHLFPVVNSNKESGKVPRFGKEHFQITKTLRPLRGSSNRLNWEMGNPVLIGMSEHDLEYPIDMRELDEAELTDLRQRGTIVTAESINLQLEKYVADLVQTPGTFPSGSKITLSASTDKWDDLTNSDPLGNIDDARDAISAKVVKDPNTIVFGRDAWRAFKRHPQVIGLISGGGSPGTPAILTTDIAAKILDVKKVVVGNALYLNASGAPTRVWGDNVILAYVPETPADQRSIYEPAFAYTIRKTGYPQIDTRTEDGKVDLVRNTDLLAQAIVGVEAGYLINDVL